MVDHLTPKKAHIDFKIHITDLFQSTFGQASLNPTTFSRDTGNLISCTTMDMPGTTDHTQ